uniref:Zinc transporter 2-like n=1 Tax=Eptatretus burgeri TaxID=7764 RepID=A0A8C4NCZ5_EPTBU
MSFTLHQTGHLTMDHHSHNTSKTAKTTVETLPESNPSVRAAFIHVIGDLLQSIGVFIAAFIIFLKPECKIADPICTFFFSFFVLGTTLTILRDVFIILMEGTPRGMNFSTVREAVYKVPGVRSVHDLHIWALTANHCAITAHVATEDMAKAEELTIAVTEVLQSRFHFQMVAIQAELYSDEMLSCPECRALEG